MKKMLVLVMFAAMTLAACGKKKDAAAPTPPATEEAAPAEGAPAEGAPAEGGEGGEAPAEGGEAAPEGGM